MPNEAKKIEPYTPGERRVLRALRDKVEIDLKRDWVALLALAQAGHVSTSRAANGQLGIDGLTDLGSSEAAALK